MEATENRHELLALTAEIVASFVGNNTIANGDVPALISSVFNALRTAQAPQVTDTVEALSPAVPIRKSIGTEYIICLEDGKKLKVLKRHLATRFNMTPDEYRRRWGLPADYPMVAPAYAAMRSRLAKSFGLGKKPEPEARKSPPPAVAAPARRTRGRQKAN